MADGDNFLELQFESGESSLSVRRFHVNEMLNELFEVNVIARSHDPNIDLESIVGKAAGFRMHTGYAFALGPERLWTGVCSHMEQVQVEVSDKGESTYFLRIVPDMWLLTQRVGNRIFQRKTLPEIVDAVLAEWKIEPKKILNKKYIPHDYVVQYGETDFAFVCRLLERAGITFHFTFEAKNDTVLTLTDQPERGPVRPGPPIHWVDNPNRSAQLEFVTKVRVTQGVRPGKFTIREYDFRKKPDFPYFSHAEPAPPPEAFYEHYHYHPGDSLRVDPPDGGNGGTPIADDKGKVRTSQQELDGHAGRSLSSVRRSRREVLFQSNCADLAPGMLFSIDRHPRSDLKPSDQLLVRGFTIEGAASDAWTFTGRAVYAKVPYMPDNKTPRPRVAGVQSAVVVGPAGKEIYTDEFGRVRVQFHWDRDGKYDDESSCWMRVSQPWAGTGYGFQLIPRVGHEVLVGYLEGDPDQPIVVGRVYSMLNRVPHKLPDHKTRSTWKSDTSPHDEGFNEIMYEDKKGEELFFVQAQRDLQKLVKREEVERVHDDRLVVVGKDRSAVVKTVDATLVGETYTQQMVSPPSVDDLQILPQKDPKVSPLPTTTEMVKKRVIFTTGKATVAFDDDSISFQADGDIKIHAHGGDAIFEGSTAWLNSIPPTSAPSPGGILTWIAGLFSSTKADKRQILNKHQASRAELKYKALSPDDKKAFDQAISKAKSDDEKAYLRKALAAGRSTAEITAFADRIRGKDATWMQDNLKLTGSSKGTGVQQQFSHSCNATTMQALRGELDPIYALGVHDQNPNMDKVDDLDPNKYNPNLAAEQKAVLESKYNGTLGKMGAGVADARGGTAGRGRWIDDKLNELTPQTGIKYETQKLGPSLSTKQAVANIDTAVRQGAPVPIVIGPTPGSTMHYVLVTGASDAQPTTYTIHDPWSGQTVTRTRDQLENGQIGIGNLNHLSAVEQPTFVN
jgi:type VI secretion system secreted protein VgrG